MECAFDEKLYMVSQQATKTILPFSPYLAFASGLSPSEERLHIAWLAAMEFAFVCLLFQKKKGN